MRRLNEVLERLGWSIPDRAVTEAVTSDSSESRVIYTFPDKSGHLYTMAIDKEDPFGNRWCVLPAEGKRTRRQVFTIGYVDASRDSDDPLDTLTLGDIRIVDTRDRHKGLGTAMLRTLFQVARQEGIRYIYGFVTPDDQQATPGLIAWYRREGFSTREGGRSTLIAIDLQNAGHEAKG